MPRVCRHRERRGGADVRADAEEDFLHTNADAADSASSSSSCAGIDSARVKEVALAYALADEPLQGGHGTSDFEQTAHMLALGYAFLRKTIGDPRGK